MLRAVQLGNACGGSRQAGIHAKHGHAELGAQPGGLAADASDPHDRHRGFGQVDGRVPLLPDSRDLLGDVHLQPPGKGQEQGHDVGADVVVVDLPRVGHHDVAGDQ